LSSIFAFDVGVALVFDNNEEFCSLLIDDVSFKDLNELSKEFDLVENVSFVRIPFGRLIEEDSSLLIKSNRLMGS
jgi:hypothetical protein